LSVFAIFPSYPFNAQVGQIVLATLTIVLVFALGSQIHSERAGLIAAGVYALWLPNLIAVWSTMQEALYVPLLVLGFVLLFRAAGREGGFWAFCLAGIVFGAAALTRSMPVYFVPLAAALLWQRRLGKSSRVVGGFLLGFSLATVPYSFALSRHLGQPTFIENHGGLRIAARYGEGTSEKPPGLLETASTLSRAFFSSPGAVLADWWRTARSLLQVNGGRLLQIYLGSKTKTEARLWKIAAHALADFLFVASLILTPFGLALARRPAFALFSAVWILLNFGLTALSGFGGPRLRAPFEPHLIVLAAVPLAGGDRRLRPSGARLAAAASLGLAALVLPQIPASLKAKADYGVHWPLDPPPKRSAMTGEAGFNLMAVDNRIEFAVRPRNPGRKTRLEVAVESGARETVILQEAEQGFAYPWPRSELVHVELKARDDATERPVRLLVVVPSR
jgi:4-amino-4-deoxy-L-arabinose transferase-like glycosyltransferase